MFQIIPLESAECTGYEEYFFYKNLYNILQNIAKFGLNIQFILILSNKVYSFISCGNSTIKAHNGK